MTADATRQGDPSGSPPQISPPLPRGAPFAQRALRFAVRILQGLHYHRALDAASAMAFHFFLSLIPLLVVLGYVLGLLVRQRGVEAFVAPLLDAIPEAATDIVRHELDRLAGATASPIAPVGVIGFFWVASSGMHGLMNVFETALHAQRRPWWKKRVIAVGWVLGSIVATSLSAWAAITVDGWSDTDDTVAQAPPAPPPAPSAAPHHARGGAIPVAPPAASPRDVPKRPLGLTPQAGPRAQHVRKRVARFLASRSERWGFAAVGLALGVCGLAVFYRYAVEHPAGVRRRAWPGSLVAMTAFLLVSYVFGAYATSLGSYALYYGGLAAVAVLLFWFYLTSLALLLGAEVNAQLEGVRDAPHT